MTQNVTRKIFTELYMCGIIYMSKNGKIVIYRGKNKRWMLEMMYYHMKNII